MSATLSLRMLLGRVLTYFPVLVSSQDCRVATNTVRLSTRANKFFRLPKNGCHRLRVTCCTFVGDAVLAYSYMLVLGTRTFLSVLI